MASTGLKGPYALDSKTINSVVNHRSPGAYALGRVGDDGTFYVSYVGRADSDVNGRLLDHCGKYSSFKFDYFGSAKAAFEKECNLYHDFEPPDNKVHPDRPNGTKLTCPRCYVLD